MYKQVQGNLFNIATHFMKILVNTYLEKCIYLIEDYVAYATLCQTAKTCVVRNK